MILVDNGGAEDRRVSRDSRVQLIRNQGNVGFGAGSNQGAAGGRANVLCLLNTDSLVEPGWLPPFLNRLADEDVGAVIPAKLNVDRSLQTRERSSRVMRTRTFSDSATTQTRRSTAFRARSTTAPPRVWPSPVSVSSQPEGSTRHTGPLTMRTRHLLSLAEDGLSGILRAALSGDTYQDGLERSAGVARHLFREPHSLLVAVAVRARAATAAPRTAGKRKAAASSEGPPRT